MIQKRLSRKKMRTFKQADTPVENGKDQEVEDQRENEETQVSDVMVQYGRVRRRCFVHGNILF